VTYAEMVYHYVEEDNQSKVENQRFPADNVLQAKQFIQAGIGRSLASF